MPVSAAITCRPPCPPDARRGALEDMSSRSRGADPPHARASETGSCAHPVAPGHEVVAHSGGAATDPRSHVADPPHRHPHRAAHPAAEARLVHERRPVGVRAPARTPTATSSSSSRSPGSTIPNRWTCGPCGGRCRPRTCRSCGPTPPLFPGRRRRHAGHRLRRPRRRGRGRPVGRCGPARGHPAGQRSRGWLPAGPGGRLASPRR